MNSVVSTSDSEMSLAAVFVSLCLETRSESGPLKPCKHPDRLFRRNYSINQRLLFDENYGLASTQSLKNKDIPEGGAKGTILPSYVIRIYSCIGN